HPDREQRLGELRLGREIHGVTRWLDEEPFDWEQSYAQGSMVLHTVARSAGLEVAIDDLVHPGEPALVRRVSCSSAAGGLVVRFRGHEALALATRGDEVVCAGGTSHAEAAARAESLLAAGFERHL